jgi:hypothetical protein
MREGSYHIFIFPAHPALTRAENKANQQCHFKSSRCRIELFIEMLDIAEVPWELFRGRNPYLLRHQNPDLDFDDMGHFLQEALLCTIALYAHAGERRIGEVGRALL